MNFRFWLVLFWCALLPVVGWAGTLSVKLQPETVVAAGAQWRVDGGAWLGSGEEAPGLFNGYHRVEFSPVGGWTAPKALTLLLNGGVVSETANYERAATLSVDLTPTAGQWRVDGGAWRKSGETAGDLAPGAHVIAYSFLDDYSPLPKEDLKLLAGQALALTKQYPLAASLQVNLSRPEAKWKINEGAWQPAGFRISGLAAGEYTLRYSVSPGWTNPPEEKVVLAPGAARLIAREYPPAPFLVSFALVPASGKFRLNDGPWVESGATASVPAGTYRVDFLPLPGMDTPVPQTIRGEPGYSFGTTVRYTSDKPTLCVVVPGQWRVDGGEWQKGGVTVPELEPGPHVIEYRYDHADYEPLPAETIMLVRSEPRMIYRGYHGKPASLQMNLTPSEGRWRLDGGDQWWPSTYCYQFGGSRIFTIRYSAVAGYETPPDETVEVKVGEFISLHRSYVKKSGR